METTIVYWGYIRIMEKKMETTKIGSQGMRSSMCRCPARLASAHSIPRRRVSVCDDIHALLLLAVASLTGSA